MAETLGRQSAACGTEVALPFAHSTAASRRGLAKAELALPMGLDLGVEPVGLGGTSRPGLLHVLEWDGTRLKELIDVCSLAVNIGTFEQGRERELQAEMTRDSMVQPDQEQRMATQGEEVVVDAHALHVQQFAPPLGDQPLVFGRRGSIGGFGRLVRRGFEVPGDISEVGRR